MSKYRPKDHFFLRAKKEGLRARSAFKLEEIARRFGLLRAGQAILDLGAAPGGFLQVIADAVGAKGLVVGVDVVPIRPFTQPHIKTVVMDVLGEDFDAKLGALHPGPWDLVVSDLAPKTSGIRATDEARSLRLAETALGQSLLRGKAGSSFVTKLFMGGDFEAFRAELRNKFEEVKVVRPEATRGASVEIYLVGLRRKEGAPNA